MSAGIEARGLRREYGANAAVESLDLSVSEGEIYGFLGPNGAGKSTSVRMLCTLLLPTAGTAIVAGYDIVDEADQVRLRIGVALQDAGLDNRQTGREILDLQGRLYGLTKAEIHSRIDEIMQFIDIGDAFDQRVGTYSGGMKRRLDLAASLVHKPSVLFLDEPTTGLDPISRARVWDEIRTLNKELGMTVFLTTQYLEEADELADRVGIINHGLLVREGTPTDLKREIGHDMIVVKVVGNTSNAVAAVQSVSGLGDIELQDDELRIASTNGAAAISPVAVALAAASIEIDNLTLRTPTLDDVFVSVTGERLEHE
jgi:ABC-2 type transport system ATP-binding protein